MANVRKVKHPSGEQTWRATVKTKDGKRRSKNFARKGDADAWIKENEGAGTGGSCGMTMLELARDHNGWFDGLVRSGERSQRSLDGYDSHLRIHLAQGKLAKLKLSHIDAPAVQDFFDTIIATSGSVETARRVKRSLSAWSAHAIRKGWMKINPVDGTKIVQKRKKRSDSRVALPAKDDLAGLLNSSLEGPHSLRDAAVMHLLMFAGLRISELLGLADDAVDLKRPGRDGKAGGVVNIREKLCSRHVTLGEVKSEDGIRDVPIGPATAAAIRAWRVARGPAQMAIVNGVRVPGRLFPTPHGLRHGPFWSYADFRRLCWAPMLLRAKLGAIVTTTGHARTSVDFGPHTLRHVYASIQIESGVTPKRLQALLGHATLAMTMDLYGHLWTDAEGDQAMAEAGERIITSRTS